MKSLSSLPLVLTAHVLVFCVQGLSRAVASEPDPIGGIRLNVTRTSSRAVLSWPLPDGNFVLESATSVGSNGWNSVSETLTITDRSCEVAVSLGPGQRYFRLRKREATEFLPMSGGGSGAPTNGYITAVLRECASAPPPPPVGEIAVGTNYVIKTIADGDPLDYLGAQQLATDAIFESLMPLYCALQGNGCVTNRVQWNLLTYDTNGNPRISGGPLSGAGFHYCAVTEGYIVAVIGGSSASSPPPPPVGQVAIGTDCVIMTVADGDPMNLEAAQQLATDSVFGSLMRHYCALPRGNGSGQVSGQARWSVATYDAAGTLKLSGCAASGCDFHECGVSRGYITAVLRDCADAPPPPPVGEIAVGTNYVIKTIADGDPLDYQGAQQLVTDAIFSSLMPLYCALQGNGCVTNRVQWNLLTYDAGGNPRISGSPLSGAASHYCAATEGYIAAVIGGSSASLPTPPPVGQVAIGTDCVVMTLADGDPMNLEAAQQLATDSVFGSLMRQYCALPRGAGSGQVSGQARWSVATYDAAGTLKLSGCAASGCDFHECGVARGYITAVLRAGCADAPPPPPVGEVAVGTNYVIKTVADGDPLDYQGARQLVTDGIFESLMPLYCALQGNVCVTNRVQWNLLTYDAGGNPRISGAPLSGPGYHYCR